MNADIERAAASIRSGLDRLVAEITACEAENARLVERLSGIEGLERSAADSLGRVIEEAEERLHEAASKVSDANERAAAAELESATIREAALNVARIFDEGGFDLLRGEASFEALDDLVATLGSD